MYSGWRGRIGHIAPCPVEYEIQEFYQMAPPGVSLVAVTLSVQEIDAKSLDAALGQPVINAIRDMAGEAVDYIVLAGEPMVFLNGYGSEARLNKIAAGITSIPFTHNLPCAVEALRHLGIKKLALATPYSVRDIEGKDVTYERWRAYLTDAGFDLVGFATTALPTNRDVSHLPYFAPYQLAKRAAAEATSRPDGVYMPCARWRSPGNIARLETDLGIPVVTSVQAWMWKALQVVGIREARPGFGRLFEGWKMAEGGPRQGIGPV